MKYIAIAVFVFLTGCASWIGADKEVLSKAGEAQQIAPFLDPLTGGLATPLTGGVTTILAGIFALNRAIVAKKRGEAIKDIDSNPDTPPASDQVSDKHQKVVIQIIGAKSPDVES